MEFTFNTARDQLTVSSVPTRFEFPTLSSSVLLQSLPSTRILQTTTQMRDYALHGVVATTQHSSTSNLACGIICIGWPSWYYALSHVIFDIKWILVFECVDIRALLALVGADCAVFTTPDELYAAFEPVSFLFINGNKIGGFSVPPCGYCHAIFWDHNRRLRRPWTWTCTTSMITHAACGGVTDCQLRFTVFHRPHSGLLIPPSLTTQVPATQLSSILCTTYSGRDLLGPLPSMSTSSGPAVHRIGRYVRANGLFPFGDFETSVICKSVFSPSKLTRRPLRLGELNALYDLPHSATLVTRRILNAICCPIKMFSNVVATCILSTGGDCFRASPTVLTVGLSDTHHTTSDVPFKLPSGTPKPIVPIVTPNNTPSTLDEPRNAPSDTPMSNVPSNEPYDLPSCAPKTLAPSTLLSDTPSRINGPPSAPGDVLMADEGQTLAVGTPSTNIATDVPSTTPTRSSAPSNAPSDISMTDIPYELPSGVPMISGTKESGLPSNWIRNERHDRIESSVKHDDAEVPVFYWNESLQSKLGYKLTIKQLKALSVLRKAIAIKWRALVTSSFCEWMRCRTCYWSKCERIFHLSGISSVGNVCCTKCLKKNKKKHKPLVEFRSGKYFWKPDGKLNYSRWFGNFYSRNNRRLFEDNMESRLAGIDCIERVVRSSEWEWDDGSRVFFWRWGPEFWKEARDGARVWVKADLPKCRDKQSVPKDNETKEKVKKKIQKVRSKRYIFKGHVFSLTSFFDVPKGEWDIRLVYNGSSSGLNDAVWAPWFCLPTVQSHLRAVSFGTYMADCDIGEMFLNFMLDVNLREYAGVDLTELFDKEANGEVLWERWERLLMGFKCSPYLTCRDMKRVEPTLKGDRSDPNNVFRWDRVERNLPGSESYDPSLPWMYKVRRDGTMAADLFIYVDDLRPTGPSKGECWDGSHQIGCRLTWFGIQDASRKRREASQTPGAWAGSIIHTMDDKVCVLVSQDKWDKTKKWVAWMEQVLNESSEINHKELERCRGFLIYVSRTYRPFIPYLRGVHKTIDNWRHDRDEEGWKIPLFDSSNGPSEFVKGLEGPTEPTENVKIVPRLRSDVKRLVQLTEADAPPKVIVRRKRSGVICYGFGDASGSGFGNCITVDGIAYSKYGTWSNKVVDKHSNYKELCNLVNAVEEAYLEGLLKEAELFLFTDNTVAEASYYNGGSNKNKELDGLVFRLWKLQMKGDFTLHIYHVSGTRMIESGIDGLSRGDKLEGVSKGHHILKYIPIHLSPMERSRMIKPWIESWWDSGWGTLTWMSDEDWFDKSMMAGNFVWDIPPAAGDIGVEQLCYHMHGRPDSLHIVLIPRLCTSLWRKQLGKCSDLVLTIQPKEEFWPSDQHEPLMICFCFPLLPHDRKFKPWKLKGTRLVDNCRRYVHGVQAAGGCVEWNCLCKLLQQARQLPSMPYDVARELLQETD